MELGALIRDIKDLGSEAAIRKWKDDDPDDWRKLNRMYRESPVRRRSTLQFGTNEGYGGFH